MPRIGPQSQMEVLMSRPRYIRHAVLAVVAGLSSFALAPTLLAQADAGIEVDSTFRFLGRVNADGTLVRSGPSEGDYATLKLDRGSEVIVVGYKFDWLKIAPPPGSFCLIPQAFVERSGDGKVGRVGQHPATVRIGSSLTPQKHKVPLRLEPGATVTILGTQDEFYQIVPPEGVYLYIDKRAVDPIRRIDANAPQPPSGVSVAGSQPPAAGHSSNATGLAVVDAQPSPVAQESLATSQPNQQGRTVEEPVSGGTTSATTTNAQGVYEIVDGKLQPVGTTRPAVADAGKPAEQVPPAEPAKPAGPTAAELLARFNAAEARHGEFANAEITAVPFDELISLYTDLRAEPALPAYLVKAVDFRIESLKMRKEVAADFLEAQRRQLEADARQRELAAEQSEIERRIAADAIQQFAAVGKLTMSSLQVGTQTLFRLVDPGTGRTILYVRSNDPAVASMVNQFVGLQGEVLFDEGIRLTAITPTSITAVDPTLVNEKVFADYMPPSMLRAKVAGETSSNVP